MEVFEAEVVKVNSAQQTEVVSMFRYLLGLKLLHISPTLGSVGIISALPYPGTDYLFQSPWYLYRTEDIVQDFCSSTEGLLFLNELGLQTNSFKMSLMN